MRDMISKIVSGGLPYKQAIQLIKQKVAKIPEAEKSRFSETIETELISMHPGNIAPYPVRPAEFERWKERWG